METNSHADTDHTLPSEDAASTDSADRGEASVNMDAPLTQQVAADEEQVAAAEGVPEPVAELSTGAEASEEPEAQENSQELNVTGESATEVPADVAPQESAETGVSEVSEGVAPASEVPGDGTSESDPLNALAEQSQRARLSAADEERATTLLKEALLDGRAGVTRSVAILPKLPWIIGVSAVSAVWKDMKTAFRTQLLSGLGKNETDSARRMRLSLARGLFKVDVPTALKLAVAVAKEMRDKETGALTPKNAQIFANVLIGRAKPWVAQIPLNDLKPAEADLLVHCALVSAFSVPHAPVTQLGVIKWAADAGRLTKLHDAATESATRGLGRWSAKWQGALRKEVADLPEAILEALKAPAQQGGEEGAAPERRQDGRGRDRRPAQGQDTGEVPADSEKASEAPAAEEIKDRGEEVDDEEDEDDDEDADEDEDDEREDSGEQPRFTDGRGGGRDSGKPRPVYESKTVPRKPGPPQGQQPQPQQQQQPRGQVQGRPGAGAFDLRDTLRQIESHVAGLRSELVATQSKLRQREQDSQKTKRAPDRAAAPIIPGEPTPDELARLNQQLEARNAELQQRITELTQDSEDRAASMGRHGPEPVEQPDAQLRTLLSLKLQEDYEDFAALEKEKPDLVVQQHYRTVLRHVLDVLRQEGVEFHARKGE